MPALVLDPFSGSGTVGVVALRHGRAFLGIEMKKEYQVMGLTRIAKSLVAEERKKRARPPRPVPPTPPVPATHPSLFPETA